MLDGADLLTKSAASDAITTIETGHQEDEMDLKNLETWDLWYPGAGATGLPFARGRLDPATVMWVHSAPKALDVTVRDAIGRVVAEGKRLRREGEHMPLARLERVGSASPKRERRGPTSPDAALVGTKSGQGRPGRARWQGPRLNGIRPTGSVAGKRVSSRHSARPGGVNRNGYPARAAGDNAASVARVVALGDGLRLVVRGRASRPMIQAAGPVILKVTRYSPIKPDIAADRFPARMGEPGRRKVGPWQEGEGRSSTTR